MKKLGLSWGKGCKRACSQPEGARVILGENLIESIQATKLGVSQKINFGVLLSFRRTLDGHIYLKARAESIGGRGVMPWQSAQNDVTPGTALKSSDYYQYTKRSKTSDAMSDEVLALADRCQHNFYHTGTSAKRDTWRARRKLRMHP